MLGLRSKGAGGYDRLAHMYACKLVHDLGQWQRIISGLNPLWFWEDGDDVLGLPK